MALVEEVSPQELAAANEELFEKFASGDDMTRKSAAESMDAYTRVKFREECSMDIIIPPETITNQELDRELTGEDPVKFEELEPWSPGAMAVSYNKFPDVFYIHGNRYKVTFQRLMSRKFMKDVNQLRTYRYDLRQIFSDDAVSDILDLIDQRFYEACDDAMYGLDATNPATNHVQYQSIASTITRDALVDSTKIMPSMVNHIEPSVAVANNITMREFLKMGRDEIGGDASQDMMMNGFTAKRFVNLKWIFTIKQNLVVNGRVIFFAKPDYFGKHYELDEMTMYVDRTAFLIEYFHWLQRGFSIGNLAGVCSAKFQY